MVDFGEVWRTQQNAQFPPSCLGLAIDGVKLVQLDAAAGALLTASLRTDGVVRPLDDKKRRELASHMNLIARALTELRLDPDGQRYFGRLALLAAKVFGPRPT